MNEPSLQTLTETRNKISQCWKYCIPEKCHQNQHGAQQACLAVVHVIYITQLEVLALQQSFLDSTAQQTGSKAGKKCQTMEGNCNTHGTQTNK